MAGCVLEEILNMYTILQLKEMAISQISCDTKSLKSELICLIMNSAFKEGPSKFLKNYISQENLEKYMKKRKMQMTSKEHNDKELLIKAILKDCQKLQGAQTSVIEQAQSTWTIKLDNSED